MRVLLLNKISQMEAFNRNNKTEILLLFEYQKCRSVKTIGGAGLSLETELDVDLVVEISRVQGGGRPPGCDTQFVDVYNEKPVRAVTKVIVPVKQHPKVRPPPLTLSSPRAFQFNFVGKLLGPRGSSLKQLQSSSMTKMAIPGKGSMRNPAQEEELRASTDPKHSHLGEDLHVEVSTFASPAEAHARLALALSEIRAYLIPDSNDQIRQQQMRDIKMIKMSGTEGPSEVGSWP